MKPPSFTDRLGESESSVDDQISETLVDALAANNKVIEIRPAKRPRGLGLKTLLLLGVGAIGFAYWIRNSQKTDDFFESVTEKTTDQAAETIEAGSETASERIEAGSERAGEAVEAAGTQAADRTEAAGETAADEADSDTSRSSET